MAHWFGKVQVNERQAMHGGDQPQMFCTEKYTLEPEDRHWTLDKEYAGEMYVTDPSHFKFFL